ncbi:glycosyltransferase family 4 protein [Lentibacillus saliphilus]|uniref:glycosyltransferase family 4 protein n=1 Tax=Lentibacillus saliphilus TaxID=2737028 RepID=UPI001C310078|nr:MraY family glycosyltransferase [Lentibacillus saliphilus]
MMYVGAFALCFIVSVLLTPLVKKFAIKIGAVDYPNGRKIHQGLMPRLGGLAIVGTFMLGFMIFRPDLPWVWPVIVGGFIIASVGFLDDRYDVSPKFKLVGQIVAASIAVFGGVQIDFITMPSGNEIQFGYFAIPLTIIWIVGITNAINLIDGLDGLAAGVSTIVLMTISGLAVSMGAPLIALMGLLLLGSTLGFLLYNFYPAKIFMGDTGSLFLGYMIAVLSVAGLFKNVAIFSLAIPVLILAIPILDTFLAIIRRFVNKQPLTAPDKLHLHHCLINMGYSHRQTVILIYGMSGFFSVAAIVLTRATLWGSTLLIIGLLILVELFIELAGIISYKYRPLLNLFDKSR